MHAASVKMNLEFLPGALVGKNGDLQTGSMETKC